MTRNLSPELLQRIDRLSACQGQWVVDCRALEGDYSYALRSLGEAWPFSATDPLSGRFLSYWHASDFADACPYPRNSPEAAAFYCAHTGWQARLLFCSDYLREDCSWPGGYSPSAVYRSNARVFRDQYAKELQNADADADDISLDVRYLTADMLETLESLESYPLINEDDHSALELDDQQEAWESWAAADWRRLVCKALDDLLPGDASQDGDDILGSVADADDKLAELFRLCCESANEYWEEQGGYGQWINLERVATALDAADLRDLTGLQLLPPDQQWRREPYPWPGAEPSPLITAP